jgi:hypothetical protein
MVRGTGCGVRGTISTLTALRMTIVLIFRDIQKVKITANYAKNYARNAEV